MLSFEFHAVLYFNESVKTKLVSGILKNLDMGMHDVIRI